MLGEWLTDRLILWETCEHLTLAGSLDPDVAEAAESFSMAFRGEAEPETIAWCQSYCVAMQGITDCDLGRELWKVRSRAVGRLLQWRFREWQ